MSAFSSNGRGGHSRNQAVRPDLRERFAALRHLPAFFGLIWQTHHGYTVAIIAMRSARAFAPVASLWVGKLIIDEVIAATQGTGDLTILWRYVALEVVIVVFADILARASALAESLLGDLFTIRISIRIMSHASKLDLAQFEDPDLHDHLERAQRQTAGEGIGLVTTLLTVAQNVITLITLAFAIVTFNIWLAILLLVAIIPSFVSETHFAALEYSLLFHYTPERRLLNYLRGVASSERTAKEVRMFGLTQWLTNRYSTVASRFYTDNRRLAARKSLAASLLGLVGTAGYYAAYVLIVLVTIAGTISVGQLTFLAGSFLRSRDVVQRILLAASSIYERSLYLSDLFIFLDMHPRLISAPGAAVIPTPIREGFVFENVSFQYPGTGRWAVRHVNLRFGRGECIALVGENGAGKTTLIKLLARLYDPTEGRITLDGVDLRDWDLASLRNTISVIFQDFMRYEMCFDENIGVGQIDHMQDYLDSAARAELEGALASRSAINPTLVFADDVSVPAAIRLAAERSRASAVLTRLPAGYRQMLGRRFDGGVNLSGGEWQTIALARAYIRMRDAQILILDEPTAALDARAEYEVFRRFQQLTTGRMAVLISHRFSTVRLASRIAVLADGRIVEVGTHEELIARAGLYAELFGMQAAAYR